MTSVTVRVPGKVMLAGEYSVLKGGACLSSTVDGFLTARITLQSRDSFEVSSNLWQKPVIVDDGYHRSKETKNILADTVSFARQHFKLGGGALKINSQLDIRHGFGSSSALRLAVLGAFNYLSNPSQADPLLDAQALAYDLQKSHQKNASGYDILTQHHGGLIRYQPNSRQWPGKVTKIKCSDNIYLNDEVHILVGGKGAPTKKVMNDTLLWLQESKRFEALQKASEQLIERFQKVLESDCIKGIAKDLTPYVKQQRRCLEDSPHYPSQVAQTLMRIEGCDKTWSYKTTGAGGEDALLIFANRDVLDLILKGLSREGWHLSPYGFSNKGSEIIAPSAQQEEQ